MQLAQRNRTILTNQNFVYQILEYGFFADQIPPCFWTAQLTTRLNNVMPLISYANKADKTVTSPVVLSSYKNELSRRVLSLPNIEAFLKVVKLMSDNWAEIKQHSTSPNSLSPITYFQTYPFGDFELINDANIRDQRKHRSDFIESMKECIRISLGYKYRMVVDISNFYDSIYTHSVSWSILGKNVAKEFMKSHTPVTAQAGYELGDKLDIYTRLLKNNETNGIIVGPFTSRIFSEIILAGLDRIISSEGFHFRRYIDDYKFYFRTETQAIDSIPIIQRILNDFNLNLNTSKTEISKFPYEIIPTMRDSYSRSLVDNGVFGVLNAASEFFSKGDKGAYKYALKLISDIQLDEEQMIDVLPTLFNIMLVDPKNSKYVVKYLLKNRDHLDCNQIEDIVNRELDFCLQSSQQQEALWFLFLATKLRIKIAASIIIGILNNGDDYSIIIALDIIKNRPSLIKRTRACNLTKINEAIDTLCHELTNETMNGSRWLLLYEILFLDLIDVARLARPQLDPFYTELLRLRIHFYKRISRR